MSGWENTTRTTAIKNTPGTDDCQSEASSALDLALAAITALEGRAIVLPQICPDYENVLQNYCKISNIRDTYVPPGTEDRRLRPG